MGVVEMEKFGGQIQQTAYTTTISYPYAGV
jgi:hypothetical protein